MTRILIVEDDPGQVRALSREFLLLRPDLTILTSHNGREAMQLISERHIDMLLTDLELPEVSGYELLAWVRSNHPDVCTFTMSAYGTENTAAELSRLGAAEYFNKPIDAKTVLTRLVDILDQSVRGQVEHVSLASFLQLLEMERKTCTLTVTSDDRHGTLVVRKGVLVRALSGELHGEAAAIAIIAWPYPTITISRPRELASISIHESLGFMVMEAMRLQDEAARNSANGGQTNGSVWPSPLRTWRPSAAPSDRPARADSSRPRNGELGLPSGARALALVETTTGNVLRAAARDDCPVGELARLASHLLQQEAATLELCHGSEGVEELVLSTSSRCDVIRPVNGEQFAMLIFAPEETNLVMARLELDHFILAHAR